MAGDDSSIPKRTSGGAAHAMVKAVLSAVPAVGGPAVELFQFVVQPPLEKRREEWMRDVGEKLQQLETQGFDLSKLQDNEEFVSAVMQASQAALRTHKAEKRAALRNEVLNVATGQGPDETTQHLLLGFVDELSEMHLRILKAFQKPSAPPGMSMGGLEHVIEYNLPELRGQRELYRQLWRDLYARGLLNTENVGVTMSESGLVERRTTGLGEQLLKFIAE